MKKKEWDLESLQQQMLDLTEEYAEENPEGWFEPSFREGIFGKAAVIYLMLLQAIEKVSMSGVIEMMQTGAADLILKNNENSGRLFPLKISNNTGGYSQARSKLEKEEVEEITESMNQAFIKKSCGEEDEPVFLLDGTTVVLQKTKDIEKEYPRRRNQNRKYNHPEALVLFATHLRSGVGVSPVFGPAGGKKATSEQRLCKKIFASQKSARFSWEMLILGCFLWFHMRKQTGIKS